LTVVGRAPAQPALPVADNTPLAKLLETMSTSQTEFPEVPADPQTKFESMLNALSTKFSRPNDTPPFQLTFDVNIAAFKEGKVEDVMGTAFVGEKGMPRMLNVTLEQYFRKILERIPAASGTTFLYRK